MPVSLKKKTLPKAIAAEPSAQKGTCGVFTFSETRVAAAKEALPDHEVIEDVADMFKVLAHPTRVRIVHALAREELCVCDLAQVLGLTVSAASHQLRAMRKSRLVQYRMDGKLAFYRLRDPFVLALLEDGIRHVTGKEAES